MILTPGMEIVHDTHPDPLIVASEYSQAPPPGWLFLRAIGTTDRGFDPVILDDPRDDHEHSALSLPVIVVHPGPDHTEALGVSPLYHHPSDEWVREVARQLLAGERRIIYGTGFWQRSSTQVCRVHLYRAPARKNMTHAAPIEEVLTSRYCTVLRAKETTA